MTCIVALEHQGKVYMGGDSAACEGWNICETSRPKVFYLGNMVIGYTSSFRMGQLLQYNLSAPKREHSNNDDMRYLVAQFIPAVRDCLKVGGYTKIENNQEEGGIFLLGWYGKIYKITGDFQVLNTVGKFTAIGCAEHYAMGALAAMNVAGPEKAILRALEIAGTFSNGVRGPYYVLSA